MLLYAAALISGIAVLVWGADRMVDGASVTAHNMGISPMLVGLTVVGFATSAPEIVVSITAALNGVPNLAIGNAIGSNIANIGLVGGMVALLWPLKIESQTLRSEFPVMVAVSVIPFALLPDAFIGRIEGAILLLAFAGFFYWIIRLGLRTRGQDAIEAEFASEIPANMTQRQAWFWIVAGLALLVAGSQVLVWGAENIARTLQISEHGDRHHGRCRRHEPAGTGRVDRVGPQRRRRHGFWQRHRLKQLQYAGRHRHCGGHPPGTAG